MLLILILLLFIILTVELLFSVDVIAFLFYTTSVIISYTSLLSNILLLITFYIIRTTQYFQASFGILLLCYSFDYVVSSAISSLWLCLSGIMLSIPIMASTQLGAVYILMSTVTVTIYWCGILQV